MKTCSVQDCIRKCVAKGLCQSHYNATPERKQRKNTARRSRYAEDPGYREQMLEKERTYVNGCPKRRERRDLRAIAFTRLRDTGCSDELWKALLRFQSSKCAICTCDVSRGLHKEGACCDHWEPEGVKTPRGVLCRACNTGLGIYESRHKPIGLLCGFLEDYLNDTPVMKLAKNT